MAEDLLNRLKGKYVLISTDSDGGILGYAARIVNYDSYFIRISNCYAFDGKSGNYKSYDYIKRKSGKVSRKELKRIKEILENINETKLIPKKSITGIERLVSN